MYQAFLKEIKSFLEPDQILCREPMKHHTSFRVGGPADYFIRVYTEAQLAKLVPLLQQNGLPYFILGKGSNLLVSDEGYRGVILLPEGEFRKIEAREIRILAGAAVSMNKAAETAAEKGLTGLEFASGIPGTVGGGVTMNAGAYGGEMAQVVTRVKGIRPDGEPVELSREEMQFGYRSSAVREKNFVVTEVTFDLQPGDPEEIRARMAELNAQRAGKQPLDQPSAGSTFKRPEGFFAAALIDQCGLKGYSVGGARVSMKHAGFLVNNGTSSRDYLDLMEKVQQIVEERVGVKLEPEIRIIGEEAEV